MIEFSEEILTHFKCDQCKKWWTIGDWVESDKMFCPHCGIVHYEFKRAEDSLGFRTAERDVLQKRVAELEGAHGAEFDRLFAEYMILHHEGAIQMAQSAVNSSDPRVAALAQAIIDSQKAELVDGGR